MAQPDIGNRRWARHPEGPLTCQGPPIVILPSDFGYFILQKWKKHCKKEQKMSPKSPLTSQGIPHPQFQYSPWISATSFGKYDKTLIFFVKKCNKRKMTVIWRPPTCDWGARAPCAPLAAPLRPTTDEWKCDSQIWQWQSTSGMVWLRTSPTFRSSLLLFCKALLQLGGKWAGVWQLPPQPPI